LVRAKKGTPLPTTPQAKLAAVIKSARDAMRKDAGLNGDLDRIPQLAWLLFLRAFDGMEQNREVTDPKFRPAIEEPYRWRDWAADPNGPTGDSLLKFVNDGLLPNLRGLTGTGAHDPRDVLAAVFKETHNRMLSGYLLRDVVNKANEINFTSSDDIHTMAHLYESMLREVRDAAGDSGEFYTPRPIIRFATQQVDPKLGEIVLDPACGTGGFLVEALEHLAPQVQTAQQRRALHNNLRGIEKKPLPFLLGMMNLVLHGIGQPSITRGNALATPITQIGKAQRVDVVLTNPPFGEPRVFEQTCARWHRRFTGQYGRGTEAGGRGTLTGRRRREYGVPGRAPIEWTSGAETWHSLSSDPDKPARTTMAGSDRGLQGSMWLEAVKDISVAAMRRTRHPWWLMVARYRAGRLRCLRGSGPGCRGHRRRSRASPGRRLLECRRR
jgi:N-6 DNA Methylase/HsdM N-terminal domain